MTPLERRYRRLLLAYPAAYRRRHGDELVTTLLDAAAPGRVRPGRRDTADLVRGGLRQRFRLPVGKAPVAVAVFAAMLFGALGAGAGSFLGWCTVAPLRVEHTAAQVASLALGEPYLGGFSRDDRWQHRADKIQATDPRYVPGWTRDAAGDRFTAAGWSIESVGDASFVAGRGDLRVRVSGPLPDPTPSDGIRPVSTLAPVDVVIWPEPPAAVPVGVAAGWLAGAVGGWLLAAWTAYALLGTRSWPRRGAVVVLLLASLLVLLRPALVTCLLMVANAVLGPDHWGPQPPVHTGFIDTDAVYVPLLGLAAIAVACLVAGGRRQRPEAAAAPSEP
ncbi:hypothetical protein OHA72_29795 [Dactylosporangium sp. NBC_01737]|uniref:hypothetical protein n=1 Tax=Dactylosporangium sp. NBC_01737 TaxID=2975959 RepID=UPI002E0D29A2|nr:hypothetical protein OHA72_29795 [Dactylosporangium sp. NBC_01737]